MTKKRPTTQLSPRMLETLSLYSVGCSELDIASKLGITTRTVRKYIELCRVRLEVETTVHAVARGLRLGIIE